MRIKLNEIKKSKYLRINAPVIQHMMTGASEVGVFHDGEIRVRYECGTVESVRKDQNWFNTVDADLFTLVSAVQS